MVRLREFQIAEDDHGSHASRLEPGERRRTSSDVWELVRGETYAGAWHDAEQGHAMNG